MPVSLQSFLCVQNFDSTIFHSRSVQAVFDYNSLSRSLQIEGTQLHPLLFQGFQQIPRVLSHRHKERLSQHFLLRADYLDFPTHQVRD